MQVESRDHRHIRTDNLAHDLQDVAVSVVVDLGNHGTMQSEKDTIERTTLRPGPPQPIVKQPGHMLDRVRGNQTGDRKSTRLNSSHANISYAVFCLKKKK